MTANLKDALNDLNKSLQELPNQLDRLWKCVDSLDDKTDDHGKQIATLTEQNKGLRRELMFRSGVWAAIGAAIPVAIALIILLIKTLL